MRVSPYLSMLSRQIIISPCSGPTQSQQRITMWYTWYCQHRLSSILSKIMLLIWDRNFKLIAQKKNSCIFSPKSASWRSTNPHFPPESSITRSTGTKWEFCTQFNWITLHSLAAASSSHSSSNFCSCSPLLHSPAVWRSIKNYPKIFQTLQPPLQSLHPAGTTCSPYMQQWWICNDACRVLTLKFFWSWSRTEEHCQ